MEKDVTDCTTVNDENVNKLIEVNETETDGNTNAYDNYTAESTDILSAGKNVIQEEDEKSNDLYQDMENIHNEARRSRVGCSWRD